MIRMDCWWVQPSSQDRRVHIHSQARSVYRMQLMKFWLRVCGDEAFIWYLGNVDVQNQLSGIKGSHYYQALSLQPILKVVLSCILNTTIVFYSQFPIERLYNNALIAQFMYAPRKVKNHNLAFFFLLLLLSSADLK